MKRSELKKLLALLFAVSVFCFVPVFTLAVSHEKDEIYFYESSAASENGYAANNLVDENGRAVNLNDIAYENRTDDYVLTQGAEDYSLPSIYDSREYGYITSVKKQQGGTCWANAATGCMEASSIKQGIAEPGKVNYSEMHLAWSLYFQKTDNTDDPTYGDGSNRTDMPINLGADEQSAMSMLARWSGMANESDYPQKASVYATRQHYINNMTYADRYASVVHLENYVELPDSVHEIKQAIIDNGAVCVSYSSGGKNYPYYYPEGEIDHSILVVGWNDNISVEEFDESSRPAVNGAWLCKNSWGTTSGDNGYFYMSYDQTSFSRFFYYSSDSDYYHNNYQYCGTLPSFYELKSSEYVGSANVFTAKGNESLEAVGAYLPIRNMDYIIEIYKNLPTDYSDPVTGGTLAATVSGSREHSGYYTIELDESVRLSEGEVFSVVLRTSASWTKSRFIAIGSKSYEHYESGRGYIFRFSQWDDAASAVQNDVYLRAFTVNLSAESFKVDYVDCGGEILASSYSDENGNVEMPSPPEGCAYEFKVKGADFDGKNITGETTVTVHKYIPDETIPSKRDICRLECKCNDCGKVLWDTSAHIFEETAVNDFGCRRTESLCTLCGYYKTDFEFPANTKNGIINDHAAWYTDSGTLYIVGRGEVAFSGSSTVTQIEGWADELQGIRKCRIGNEITALPKGFLSSAPNLTEVEIPEGITRIQPNSFSSAVKLQTVRLPSTLKSIGKNSFSLTSISSLHIPDSVEVIEDGAFASSNALTELTGLKGIKEIGERAFSGSLISGTITLPSTLRKFGCGAFSNTQNLTDVVIHPDCDLYKSENGYILSADGAELLYYSSMNKNSVLLVPETVRTIGDYTFDKNRYVKFIDMSGVTKIGVSAFQNSSVVGVGFETEENVVIGSYAFRNALSLKTLYIPSNVTFVSSFSVGYSAENKVLSDITVYCDSGSAAATYAKSAKISYITDHSHEFKRIPIVAATCYSTGTSYMYCSECGCVENAYEVYSVTHDYLTVYDKAPTCVSEGLSHQRCSYCGKTDNPNTVEPAKGHSYEWITDIEATCTESGHRYEKCSVCNEIGAEETVDAYGHDFEWIVDEKNGCGWEGYKHEECKVCGFTQSHRTVIPAHKSHPASRYEYECRTDGMYRYKVCIDCAEAINEPERYGSVHYRKHYISVKEATCLENGEYYYQCLGCDYRTNSTIVKARGYHDYGSKWVETSPTCLTDGLSHAQCQDCGYICDYVIKSEGKHMYEWVIDVDSDCANEGVQHQECVNCGEIASEGTVLEKKMFHTYNWVTDREPTCTEVGLMHRLCRVCGDVDSENTEIAMISHAYEWVTDVEPTCGIKGLKHQQCTACSDIVNENTVINATGNHSYEWVIDEAGDCLTEGRKHQYCSVCNSVASRNTVIYPRGEHEFAVVCDSLPDCTENGMKRIACIHCNKTESEEIRPATGHTYGEWSESRELPFGKLESERHCITCGYVQYRNHTVGNVINLDDFIKYIISRIVDILIMLTD